MKLKNEFVVAAPLERAWSVLLDVERIAPCLPGAALTGRSGEEFQGQMRVKLGPILSTYTGTLRIEQADESRHHAVLVAAARDARQGTVRATIDSLMQPDEGGTRVVVETDLGITGPAAQFGRGVMQEVSGKLMREFAAALQDEMLREPDRSPARNTDSAQPGFAETTSGGEPAVPESAPSRESASSPVTDMPGAADGLGEENVLDLAAASREAVLRRIVPIAGAVLLVLLVLRLVLRRLR